MNVRVVARDITCAPPGNPLLQTAMVTASEHETNHQPAVTMQG